MKKILLSFCMAFSVFASGDLPLDKIDFNNPNPITLEDFLYDQIDLIDDEITVGEHTITHYDNATIYQMGYKFGRRRAFYEVLGFLGSDR